MNNLEYTPPNSVLPFLMGDKFIELIMGPVGSTKTTAAIMKVAFEAKRVAPCRDGIRRTRCAVIRNTNQMLSDTTIPDFLKWYPDGVAGSYAKTEKRFILRFDDVECEVLFRGLEDANDVRRLLSLQLSFGVMDEFREISPDIFNALQGRLGRYPDKSMNGVGCCDDHGRQVHKVWGATNPPGLDSFWGDYVSNPPTNAHVTWQPSGLSEDADWVEYLPNGYYEQIAEGKDEDWVDVYVHGKLGRSLSGKPVFRCFNRELHIAKETLVPRQNATLIIGADAGLNPSVVIAQLTFDGRLLVFDALTGAEEGMGSLRFIRERLKPLLVSKYPGVEAVVIIDPAAFQRAQTDERCVADMYKQEGFMVKPAVSNALAARLGAVENYLTRLVDGKPAMLLDPGADLLIQALSGKYRYKTNTKGETADTPEKSHPWSDIADALQYTCLHADGGGIFGRQLARGRAPTKVVSMGGWV